MLNTFNSKKSNFNTESLYTPHITEKTIKGKEKNEMKSNSVKNEYNNLIIYPSSSKEWLSSVYSYNKSFIKTLISKDAVLKKLFNSYFNMLPYKKKTLFKRRRDNKARYSAKKIYVSRAEMEHSNTKLSIILHVYNKKKSSIKRDIRKILTMIKFKKIIVDQKRISIPNHKNRLLHLIKNNFFIFRK